MAEAVKDRTQIYSSEDGRLYIFTYDDVEETFSDGEQITVQDLLSTAQLTAEGAELWQGLLKQAIASDNLRDLTGANCHTQTPANGVYKTTATTTNLPSTNLVGILEVYNEGSRKYLRYQTYNSGAIETWTQFFDGTDWQSWSQITGGGSSTPYPDLTENADIALNGYGFLLSGSNTSEFYIELDDEGSNVSIVRARHQEISMMRNGKGFAINDNIEFSEYPFFESLATLDSNNANNAVGNTKYKTLSTTTNLPTGILKTGVLQNNKQGTGDDLVQIYTTFEDDELKMYSRKYTAIPDTWGAWFQFAGGGSASAYPDLTEDTDVGLAGYRFTFEGDGQFHIAIDDTEGLETYCQMNPSTINMGIRDSGGNDAEMGMDGGAFWVGSGGNGYTITDSGLYINMDAAAKFPEFENDYSGSTVTDNSIPSAKWINTQIDSKVAGLLDYRGDYDASTDTYPTTGGSGTSGVVLKGDTWVISVAGELDGVDVEVGDSITAKIDTPGQTAGNWSVLNTNLTYVPENVANKENTTLDISSTKYPTNRLVKEYIDNSVYAYNNGVRLDGSTVKLGGSLNESTIIGGTSNEFDFYVRNYRKNIALYSYVGITPLKLSKVTAWSNTTDATAEIGIVDDGTYNQIIFKSNGDAVFTNSVNQTSLRCADDYSANYTARSYIDKGYGDGHIGGNEVGTLIKNPTSSQDGFVIAWNNTDEKYELVAQSGGGTSYTFENALYEDSGTVVFGGGLSQNTDILVDDYRFRIRRTLDDENEYDVLAFNSYGDGFSSAMFSRFEDEGTLQDARVEAITTSTYAIASLGLDFEGNTKQIYLSSALDGIRVNDQATEFGFYYTGDYFPNGSDNNRWLPDWQSVKGHIGGKEVDTLIENPTSTQDGFVIAWNNTNDEYELIELSGGGNVSTSGTPTDNDFAKFVNGTDIEGRSYSEVRSDLGLVIGTDVQAYNTNNALTTTKLDDFGTPDDNTDLDATTTRHGLLPKLSDDEHEYLNGEGTFSNITNIPDLPTSTSGLSAGDLYTQLPSAFGGSGTQKIICVV